MIGDNLAKILEGARGLILATAGIEDELFDQGISSLKNWSARPDAAIWFAMCWAEGSIP